MSGVPSEVVTWEAVYDDGSLFREADGKRYGEIDRARLREFRLVAPGEVLAAIFTGIDGRTGWNLVYRRRSIMSMAQGAGVAKQVWFIIGWVPQGPILSVQPETLELRQADRFEGGAGPLGVVQPRVHEGETWDLQHLLHKSDARIEAHEIVLPSGYRMKGRG